MSDSAPAELQLSVPGITWRRITDQIVTAIESGSGYWMQSFRPVEDVKTDVTPWYDDEKIWSGNFNIEITDDDGKVHFFTPETIPRGLNYLASNYLWRIEQIVKDSGDAETADVFLQACLFGDIVYG